MEPNWRFKGCPKCHGDMYQDSDVYGSYFKCIQCGTTTELTQLHGPSPVEGSTYRKAKLCSECGQEETYASGLCRQCWQQRRYQQRKQTGAAA